MRRSMIDFMERNREGYWVIWGAVGMRRYLYYAKREARKRYLDECRQKVFLNKATDESLKIKTKWGAGIVSLPSWLLPPWKQAVHDQTLEAKTHETF